MEINEELSLFTLYNKIKEETSLIILNDNKLNGSWKFVGQDLLSIEKTGDSLIFKADGSALRGEIQRLDNRIDNLNNNIDAIDNSFINHNHNDGADLHSVDAIKLGGIQAADYVLKANLKPVATTGDYNDLINKPDIATINANGLMSSQDKIKLNSIAENANNYTHPTYTPQNSGLYKITVDTTGHISNATVVTKADITGLGIPETDTDTHYTSTIIVSDSPTNINPVSNITNNSIYINHIENNDITNSLNIKGTGYTTVGTNESGDIVINSDSITYSANNGIGLNGTTFYNSGVRSIATGSTNGTISVNTNGSATDVAVKGLGSAAYTNEEKYALLQHGNHVPDIAQEGNNKIFLRNDNEWAEVKPENIGAADRIHNHTSLTDVTSITGDTNQGFNITNVSSIDADNASIKYIYGIGGDETSIDIQATGVQITSDSLTLNGHEEIKISGNISIAGYIIPANNNQYDIGSAEEAFDNGYFNNLSINSDLSVGTLYGYTDNSLYIADNILPVINTNVDIGSADNAFNNGYFKNLSISNDVKITGNLQLSSTLYTSIDDTKTKLILDANDINIVNDLMIGNDNTAKLSITNEKQQVGDYHIYRNIFNFDIGNTEDSYEYKFTADSGNNNCDMIIDGRLIANNLNLNNLILNSTQTKLKITTRYEQDGDEYFDTIFNISGVEDEDEETNSIYRYKFTSGNDENKSCTVLINGRLDANLMTTKQLRLAKNNSNTIWFHNYSQNILRVNTSVDEDTGDYVQVDFTNKNITAPNFNLGTTNEPFQSINTQTANISTFVRLDGGFNFKPTEVTTGVPESRRWIVNDDECVKLEGAEIRLYGNKRLESDVNFGTSSYNVYMDTIALCDPDAPSTETIDGTNTTIYRPTTIQFRIFTNSYNGLIFDMNPFATGTLGETQNYIYPSNSKSYNLGADGSYFNNLHINTIHNSNADYAEMFEWEDGNINDEERIGLMVTLVNDKIKPADENDDILGVVSAHPSIIGNCDEHFRNKYVKDEFGRYIYKENEKIISDIYDDTIIYKTRKERKEWTVVGLVGILYVRDDSTCKVGEYCKPFKNGIVTATTKRYRSYNDNGDIIKVKNYKVMERTGKNVVKIFLRD